MVLGLRTKSRKGPSVNVEYLVHIQEIKPCPPSHSLKSLRSVLLQWENGDRNSGSTNTVVPSLGSVVGEGKIEFNESFRIPVTLYREPSMKGGNVETFQKNCIEFNLYEVRSNKTVKGQLLGTAILDVAEYGLLKETVTVSVQMNCKRSIRNAAQPFLFMKLEPFQKRNSRSSSRESLSKEASLDKHGAESVSALMNADYDEEAEIASFTDDDDDDVSQHSSLTVSSSAYEATEALPPQSEENSFELVRDSTGRAKDKLDLPLEAEGARPDVHPVTATQGLATKLSSHPSSLESSSLVGSPENDRASLSSIKENTLKSHSRRSAIHSVQSSSSSVTYEEDNATCDDNSRNSDPRYMLQEVHEKTSDGRSAIKGDTQLPLMENRTSDLETEVPFSDIDTLMDDKQCPVTSACPQFDGVDAKEVRGQSRVVANEASDINGSQAGLPEDRDEKKHIENGQREKTEEDEDHATEVEGHYNYSLNATGRSGEFVGDATSSMRDPEAKNSTPNGVKLKHVKSVRSLIESGRSKRVESNSQFVVESKEANSLEGDNSSDQSFMQNGIKDSVALSRQAKDNLSDCKLQQLEYRIEKLETELRETAALEVSLYSIVAEHGSSANKVHAPARRLSRLYLHAWKWSKPRGASAARSVVSGLVLVAKACGNDVPRLTFWLSNSIVLRAIIGLTLGDPQLPVSAGTVIKSRDSEKVKDNGSSLLKWEEFSSRKNQNKFGVTENVDDWEESHTFTSALEKIEAWIFSRIIESVWWQTLTPHMQSSSNPSEDKIPSSLRNSYGTKPFLSEHEQAHFSMELWKAAFKDACERLCPVRAAGHECGCLPVMARLVMEQCVNRLDVAMFNAILRESDDDIPTDPVSDPISDSKVLPVAAGKSSFGAGAQLKNAIGNWSRWLTDLFGIDLDDSHEVQSDSNDDEIPESDTSSKSFRLLNALSDLMMLPKDMLLNRSIRKEVCPTFGTPLIKRVLSDFSPDEFCPDPIPEEVFQALDVEDPLDDENDPIRNCPCIAAPVVYSPPSAALVAGIIIGQSGESQLRRSGSVLRKSYTSDDELDELDSPLCSITNSFKSTSTPSLRAMESGGRNVVRYELLQEVWRGGD